MVNGASTTISGARVLLNRAWKSSPDFTNFSRGGIGTGTGTPAASDTTLGTPITAWSAGSDYKAYESSYPSFDPANRRVTVQMYVTSTQANGNNISEYGDFNTDTAPSMAGRFVFTAVTKTSGIEIYFLPTYRLT